MTTFTIREAKAQLSNLIARAAAGEEIVIARGTEAVARLTALKAIKKRRVFGVMAGPVAIEDSFFFQPLPDEELDAWGSTRASPDQ